MSVQKLKQSAAASAGPYLQKQSLEEIRELRRTYNQMLFGVKGIDDMPYDEAADYLNLTVEQLEKLFQRVQGANEAALDSSIVRLCSLKCRRQVESLNPNSRTLVMSELEAKVAEAFAGEPCMNTSALPVSFWRKMGEAYLEQSEAVCRSVVLHPFLGAFELGEAEKKVRSRRLPLAKEKTVEPKKPHEVKLGENKGQGAAVEEKAEHIYKLLRKECRDTGKPVSYFKFLLDPTSYTRTIENINHIAFLVRDNRVRIQVKGTCDFYLFPVVKRADSGAERVDSRQQILIALNAANWKKLCDALELIAPMITYKK